ncbi:uncharacterized protein LOC118478562 [Aplysia californica]|uniref:Uncharacterized protein LOC118478562 n=1 Tax=Aplysia californica TaxID=6500 RepID=A0ABM1W0V6_APLCA|nr:uncharacterized protein LOC118478562 [Aplysia californica]
MTCIGDEALDALDGMRLSDEEREDLDQIIKSFDEYCIGEVNETFESYKFHKRNQKQYKTIDSYVTELRQLAKRCNFVEEDRMIRDRLVIGIQNDDIREKLLEQKKLSLSESGTLDIYRAQEKAKTQLQAMSISTEPQVNKLGKPTQYRNSQNHSKLKPHIPAHKCGRCGRQHERRRRPAQEAICRSFQKKGHFSNVCRTPKTTSKKPYKNRANILKDEEKGYLGAVFGPGQQNQWQANVTVNERSIDFKLDTGADKTVIPKSCVPANTKICRSQKRLYGPSGEQVRIVREFQAELKLDTGNCAKQKIYVLENLPQPLLGKPAIKELDMLKRINVLKRESDFKKEFPELFTSLGKLKKEYKIEMRESVIPFSVATPRRLALPLHKKVEQELKRLKEDEIIKKIDSSTQWCAPIVVVRKKEGKVRICVVLSKLNEGVKRDCYFAYYRASFGSVSGATVFSKLNCNSGISLRPPF